MDKCNSSSVHAEARQSILLLLPVRELEARWTVLAWQCDAFQGKQTCFQAGAYRGIAHKAT